LLSAAQHSHRNEAADAWYSLSRAYRLAGQNKQAEMALSYSDRMRALDVYLTALSNHVTEDPQDIGASLKLASLYSKDGDFTALVNLYKEILHYQPGNVAAKKGLVSAQAYLKAHPEASSTDQSE